MEFRIDFGNAAPAADVREPRYAAIGGWSESLGSNEVLFRAQHDRSLHLLPAAALAVLELTRPFRALPEHAAVLQQALPGLSSEGATQALQALRARGLLQDDESWLRALAQPVPSGPAAIGPVAIRACDRPQQLTALLASLAENERTHRPAYRYVVLDDSRDAGNARRNAEATAAFARELGVDAQHVDAGRWERIRARLAGGGNDAALRFLIGRHEHSNARAGGGKGYNLAALIGAGTRYVLLDEDFLLPLRTTADVGEDLAPDTEPPLQAQFYPDVDAAIAAGQALATEPVAYAAARCGHTLGALLARGTVRLARAALAGFAPAAAAHWRAGTRVAAAALGHRGASGTQSSRWMFLLEAPARERFWHEEQGYRAALRGEAIRYGPARALLLPQVAFTPFMVDGAVMPPPTMPGGRGEDLLFGALSAALHPDSAVWHSTHTIGHRQEPGGRDRAAELQQPVAPPINQFLAESVSNWRDEIAATGPVARLAAIASRIEDLSDSPARLAQLTDDYVRHVRADMIARLRRAADAAAAAPAWWRRDIEALIARNRATLIDSAPQSFADAGPGPADAAQRDLREFAQALRAWPALYDTAREQRSALLSSP